MTGVRSDRDGNTAWITFGDPKKGNAFTWELADSVTGHLREVESEVNCVVLASAGSVFCSGADLEMLEPFGDPGRADDLRELIYGSFQSLITSVARSPVPVIARLQGPALGLGADLALACDLRVASTDAWLEESWIRLGTISALGGGRALRSSLGSGDALDMLLTARRLDAATALRRGVYQRVVDPTSLDTELRRVTAAIAAADPLAVRSMKALVRDQDELDAVDTALELGLSLQVPLIARPEFATRVRQIRERLSRRDPR